MTNTHALPDSVTFKLAATGNHEFTVRFADMSDEALLKGVIRGLKNICGDSIGAKDMPMKDRVETVEKKISRFQLGEISEGLSTVSEWEKEMRLLVSAFLVARGTKKAEADKACRENEVAAVWAALVEKNKFDKEKAIAQWQKWADTATAIIVSRRASSDIVL
jgi:hypothetical protein